MANRFLNNITINDSYTLPSSDGNADQVIKTDGAGNLSFTDIVAGEADKALSLTLTVKNTESVALTKGQVVCAAPTATPPSGNVIEVKLADNNGTDSMPAIGILNEGLDAAGGANDEGEAIMFGRISGINTSAFSVGDEVFVSDTPGGLTATKPTGVKYIQKVGVVMRDDASNGTIEIFGAGRTNDVPTPLYIDHANQRVGIGEETPSSDLHINNDSTSPVLRLSYVPVGGYGGGGSIRFQGGAADYVYGDIGWWNGSSKDADITYSAASRAMSFKVNDRNISTNGYFRFYNDNTEVAEINAAGIYGNVFYDQGNSAYYVNPASTSNLNFLQLDGNLDFKSQVGTWIESDAMSDSIGWNSSYGVYIGSNIGGTHYLRANGTFTTGGVTYDLWHEGNDGSGSGLDADLLDGQQGSYYLDYNNFTNTPTIPSPYTHPTHPGDDINLDTGALTGATVISDLDFNITTDTLGHVTDANATYSTRNLTASDLGIASTELVKNYQNVNYVASDPTSGGSRINYGVGVTVYEGYSGGTNRPHSYDATVQFMPTSGQGFELSADWVSSSTTPLKIRSLRDCCQGWSPWVDVAVSGTTSSGTFSTTGDYRAPIFYDSDNTSYYVNPASTSTSLNAAGDARVKNVYISNSSGSVSNKIWFDNGGIYQPGLYFDGNNPKFIINSLVTSIFHDTYHPNADTWTTARTITIGNTGKTVDGSANVSWSLSEIGAASSSHNHDSDYVNVTGDTMTGALTASGGINGLTLSNGISGSNFNITGVNQLSINDPGEGILFGGGANNVTLYAIDDSTDNKMNFGGASELQVNGSKVFHDGYHPNADTWTTARTITIGNTGKSVNGSANVSWSLSEIGAAASSHTHDDRYYTETEMQTFFNRGYISAQSASNLAIGWYTIATNTGNRALGEFQIWDVASSRHQSVLFNASHHYGTDNSNDITVLANSRFGTDVFRYLRIREGGTYDGAALQVYIDNSTNSVNVAITGANAQSSGWVLKDWIPNATDPGDVDNYSSFTNKCQVDLDNIQNGGIATTGDIFSGGALTQYRNLTTADEGSGNGLDADLLDGQHGSYYATASSLGSYLPLSGGTMSGDIVLGANITTTGDSRKIYLSGGSTSSSNELIIGEQNNYGVGFRWDTGSHLQIDGYWATSVTGSANRDLGEIDVNNAIWYLKGQVRTPLLYDSDNTSYYLNPASTSVLNDVSGVRIWAGYDSNVDNSVSCSNWFRSSGSTGWYSASYGGGIYMVDSTWVRVYNNKKFYADNTIESNTGMYAPIFYDRNNTSYRFHGDQTNDGVDLTSSGNYAIHVAGTIGGGHRKHNNLETPEMQWSVGGGTDLNWKKLCDIVISDATYSGWGAEIEITDFSGNYGNSTYNGGELYKGALSIAHWGGSGVYTETPYANIPYQFRNDIRWYKIQESGQNRYQLQVKSPANYRQIYVKVKPGIGNQIADIIPYANDTDGATSGGTAYASIQNADFNHEFAGDIWTNDSRSIGFRNGYGSPHFSTYYGSLTTNTSVYIGGPTGNGQDLYCDDLRSNKVFDRAATAYYFEGGNTGDSIRVAGDVVAYYSSDKRLKDNIKPIENALEKVNAISGVTFEWNEKSHKTTGRKDVGVVAQEVEEVFPELVETRTNGYKAVDYQKLTAVLIESVKELTAKVEALESKQCNCK